jgi:hypothetical protein
MTMRTFIFAIALLVAATAAFGQGLEGKKIAVTGGDAPVLNAVVSIPYDGPVLEGAITVAGKDKKAIPAQVYEKALYFVSDVPAKETVTFEVKVAKAAAPKVVLTKKGDKLEIDVVVSGEPFTTYIYSNDNRKPFLWPVYGEGKVGVTRDWPMDPNAKGSTDHVHHKSIWSAYGDINGVDCWAEEAESGYQHSDDVTFGSGDVFGWIKAKNTWQDKEHKPVIAEEREYRFYASPAAARAFDAAVTFKAAFGDAKFGDTKEGGIISFRIRPDIQVNKGGTIINASGAKGEAGCWGKPSPWCDYYGDIPGTGVRGIAIFDNPGNLRHPSSWHVRGYGLNGASVFGLGAFTNKKENGEYLLANGKSLTFNYRVIIHSGDSEQAKLGEHYAAYSTALKAEWGK